MNVPAPSYLAFNYALLADREKGTGMARACLRRARSVGYLP